MIPDAMGLARVLAAVAALLLVEFVAANDIDVERGVAMRVERLRAIEPKGDATVLDRNNRDMDEAWKYFTANRARALPVLRKALAAEIARGPQRNNLVLLDIGYYLQKQGEPGDRTAARDALLALDPSAEIVRWNANQLFYYAHAVAATRAPGVLPFLDRAFLRNDVRVVVPQHAMTLDPTLVCVFVYGVYGKESEPHLRAALSDPKVAHRVIELLGWIGSPSSNAAVREALVAAGDYDTLARFTSFMMLNGGPEGRGMVLAVDPSRLDQKARDYLAQVRPSVEKVGRGYYAGIGEGFPGERKLSNDEVKRQLSKMRASRGPVDSINPDALLQANLPKDFLIAELMEIRSLVLNRVSDEALSEVKLTNAIMNGLRYRDK